MAHNMNADAGVYEDPSNHLLGIIPWRWEGWEIVPFQWCVEYPAIEDFMKRFPEYWNRSDVLDAWIGRSEDGGIYWVRWMP